MFNVEEIDLIEEILSQITSRSNIKLADPETEGECIDTILKSNLMSSYQVINFHKMVKISDSRKDSLLFISEVGYTFQNGKYTNVSFEPQLIGFKKLDFDYGHIFIRPETIEDKFSEVFKKEEIDFREHQKFSSKYYFLSENESLARFFVNESRLELMAQQREILIEINGDTLISKYSRKINLEDCENMVEFIQNI